MLRREGGSGLPYGTVIKDLALAALNKTFRLPVKIGDRAAKGPDRAHRADLGTAEGTADALFEFCASLVIEKRHCYIIISFADKIELAFKRDPIMVRRRAQSVAFATPSLIFQCEMSCVMTPCPPRVW